MTDFSFQGHPIHIAPEFGAKAAGHRRTIREALRNYVLSESVARGLPLDEAARTALSDLTKPPRVAGWAISITHCPLAGGFVAIPLTPGKPAFAIGLDLEIASRLRAETIARIATFPDEKKLVSKIKDQLHLAYFWSAKEAAIKAFGHFDPGVIPHLGNVEVTMLNVTAKTFEAKRGSVRATGTLSEPLTMPPSNARDLSPAEVLVAAIAMITPRG